MGPVAAAETEKWTKVIKFSGASPEGCRNDVRDIRICRRAGTNYRCGEGLAYCPRGLLTHRQEPLRFFDLRNFGPRAEAREGRNEQFASDLMPAGHLVEL